MVLWLLADLFGFIAAEAHFLALFQSCFWIFIGQLLSE